MKASLFPIHAFFIILRHLETRAQILKEDLPLLPSYATVSLAMNFFKYHSLYVLCFLTSALAQYGTSPSSTSSASATVATSSVISVSVGASGLVFTPDTATAAMGDNIQFHITPGHSVTQSTFSDPCHPIAGVGVYSGFPTGSTPFTITVNNTDPIWLYCSQTAGGHCQAGMAMVINAPYVHRNFASALWSDI